MEKLMAKYCEGKFVPKKMCSIGRDGLVDDCDNCSECCEDSEVQDDMCSGCPIQECFNRLGEYEDLEEQGRLLKLPCAVGDTVYRVHRATKSSPDRIYECKIVGIMQEYNTISIKLHANINEETYSIWVDDWFDRCQIGHEFFLTKKLAEEKLLKMSGKNV